MYRKDELRSEIGLILRGYELRTYHLEQLRVSEGQRRGFNEETIQCISWKPRGIEKQGAVRRVGCFLSCDADQFLEPCMHEESAATV